MRSPVSGRGLAALGRGGRTPPMLVASVVAWRREADDAAGRPRSGLEAVSGAAQTRQGTPRAREIVAAAIECHSMKVTKAVRSGTRVELPASVERPFEVYVNGVAQREGVDFTVADGALAFTRELRQEGRLGFWRWASMVFGAAGTYRQNDVVDVTYERNGQRAVASGLPVEAS